MSIQNTKFSFWSILLINLSFFEGLLTFVNPIFLPFLIQYVSNFDIPAYEGWIYLVAIIFTAFFSSFIWYYTATITGFVGIRVSEHSLYFSIIIQVSNTLSLCSFKFDSKWHFCRFVLYFSWFSIARCWLWLQQKIPTRENLLTWSVLMLNSFLTRSICLLWVLLPLYKLLVSLFPSLCCVSNDFLFFLFLFLHILIFTFCFCLLFLQFVSFYCGFKSVTFLWFVWVFFYSHCPLLLFWDDALVNSEDSFKSQLTNDWKLLQNFYK